MAYGKVQNASDIGVPELVKIVHGQDAVIYEDEDGIFWKCLWNPEDEFVDVDGFENGEIVVYDDRLKVELIMMKKVRNS